MRAMQKCENAERLRLAATMGLRPKLRLRLRLKLRVADGRMAVKDIYDGQAKVMHKTFYRSLKVEAWPGSAILTRSKPATTTEAINFRCCDSRG